MTQAKRRIKRFDFSGQGAHVALVDKAANLQEVLVMKSEHASEEEIEKALSRDVKVEMTIMEFLTRWLGLWWNDAELIAGMLGYSAQEISDFVSPAEDMMEELQEKLDSVQLTKSVNPTKLEEFAKKFSEFQKQHGIESSSSVTKDGEDGTKTEDENSIEKENQMTVETNDEGLDVQAMIEKALADRETELQKEYEDRYKEQSEQIEILKALEEDRQNKIYKEKAEKAAEVLGEDTDVEELAKAMRKAESDSEMAAFVKAFAVLQDAAGKTDGLEEIGKSATREQPTGEEAQITALTKSKVEAGMDPLDAKLQAIEEIRYS